MMTLTNGAVVTVGAVVTAKLGGECVVLRVTEIADGIVSGHEIVVKFVAGEPRRFKGQGRWARPEQIVFVH